MRQEFTEWLEAKLEQLPGGCAARLKWWLRLKKKMVWKIYRLNSQFRAEGRASIETLQQELTEHLEAVESSCLLTAAAALDQIPAAKAAVAAAEAALEERRQVKQRRSWIHSKERASRALTGQLTPPQHQGVGALMAPNGEVVGTGAGCAKVVRDHWASVCAQPSTTAEARDQVLGALQRQRAPVLGLPQAAPLGAQIVTPQEVLQALRKCKLGTAPGIDGIPIDLYKKYKAQFAPMLAAVFTAIGTVQKVPRGFLTSVITVLYKAGNRLDPGNYRPISLTNTDYRLVARVLAGRLGDVLPEVIDPAQTAFIRGRSIGENVMLLQFLPALLQAQGRTGIVAFCDFRKAYDTVDRGFLLAVAEQLGLGQGFLNWMRLVLHNTRSAAVVNGCLSSGRQFLAGVRQGCPLAPLLYLLVAQAVLFWLRDQGIGVEVEGSLMSGMQYADDLKALLAGPQQVSAFKAAMEVFAAASGQHLQPTKTKLLFIGAQPSSPLPEEIEGMKVVHSAKALGLTFSEFTGA
ncbi:MAG: reverse transcriptase family protein, partial [Rhodoferax sp.]|nr:reverse transcriptase family protein [Rhodoferax sp.]